MHAGVLCVCPECSRAFGSAWGLSQHRRHAHPSEYHAENVPKPRKKALWDCEELILQARAELVFWKAGVRNINQQLVGITPGRTLQSIKGMCKSLAYRELLDSSQPESDSSEPIERTTSTSGPWDPEDEPDDDLGPSAQEDEQGWAAELRDAIEELGALMALTSMPSTLVS